MADSTKASAPTRNGRDTRFRNLVADGYRWVVQEVAAPQFDRRAGTNLVFDGELIMRRVRWFPADWFDLSDDDLYALCLNIRNDDGSEARRAAG